MTNRPWLGHIEFQWKDLDVDVQRIWTGTKQCREWVTSAGRASRYSIGVCLPLRKSTVRAPRLGDPFTLLYPSCSMHRAHALTICESSCYQCSGSARFSSKSQSKPGKAVSQIPREVTSRKFVRTAKRPVSVTPSQVPPPCRSLPARMPGASSQKCASLVGLHTSEVLKCRSTTF
jgi:hypothetical protein